MCTRIMAFSPITSRQIDAEKMETVADFIFVGFKITADGDCSHEIKRHLLLGRKAMTNLDTVLESRDITLPTRSIVKAMVFRSHVQMWEMDHNEGWVPKNWCFWTVVLKKNLESPMDSKEIKPVNPKGNQPWIFIGRTDAEAKAPVLWPPDGKSWLTGKDPDAGKDWGQEEKGAAENDKVEWHHQLKGHEFEQIPGDSEEQGCLMYSSLWGCKDLDTTEQLTTRRHFMYFL